MAISRFGPSALHQRDPRSALFDSYTGDRNRTHSASPARTGSGYGYPGGGGSGSGIGVSGSGMAQVNGGFRVATPNSRYVREMQYGKVLYGETYGGYWRTGMRLGSCDNELLILCRYYRGQYSDAVLSELENQNDQHIEGISAKVKMLKDVRAPIPDSTVPLLNPV